MYREGREKHDTEGVHSGGYVEDRLPLLFEKLRVLDRIWFTAG